MKTVSFNDLYNTEFFISEVLAKPQFWHARGNIYNCIGKPKISHTLLWFKNCSAVITDKSGTVLEAKQNQLIYTGKGTEYTVMFEGTSPEREDTVVIHFQMTDNKGEDIVATNTPLLCTKHVDPTLALAFGTLVDECKNNMVCLPVLHSELYKILGIICKKEKKHIARDKYACIRTGIELLEQDSDLSIAEIAAKCGVSECYFRRLFSQYSGESPMSFRQHYRIERAKQLLLSDEQYTIGEIAQELNFLDIYHFSKTFKKYCGVSPNKYLQQKGLNY